jgi:PEGA domain
MGLFRGASRHVGGVLALALLTSSAALAGEKTVWLVRPLYPGQEALVAKIEQSLVSIIPDAQRGDEIIGLKELGRVIGSTRLDALPCLSGDERCPDPIDPFMQKLGIDRVVMVQGGQDEAGYNFKVTSYRPGKGETLPASASNAVMDRAFLGAIVKVVPLASTLDVTSIPSGAVVYVDDQKVGVTPLSTQVLPGNRLLKVDLKQHEPIEKALLIQARATGKFDFKLEKVAARLSVSATPPGTTISIDGQVVGKDRIDRGISPGRHTIRLAAEGYKQLEETIEVKPDQQFSMEKSLEPIPGADKPTQLVVVERTPDAVVTGGGTTTATPEKKEEEKPPPTWTEQVYARGTYFYLGFDNTNLLPRSYLTSTGRVDRLGLVARRWGTEGIGRSAYLNSGNTSFPGVSGEFGIMGKYFGITVLGVSVHFNPTPLNVETGTDGSLIDPEGPSQVPPVDFRPTEVRSPGDPTQRKVLPRNINVNLQLYTLRAIHLQLRLAAWRFAFNLAVGPEFRAGYVLENAPTAQVFYKDGFGVLDLLLGIRVGVRFYLIDGFFLNAMFNYQQYLYGESAVVIRDLGAGEYQSALFRGPSGIGFNVGVGYAF